MYLFILLQYKKLGFVLQNWSVDNIYQFLTRLKLSYNTCKKRVSNNTINPTRFSYIEHNWKIKADKLKCNCKKFYTFCYTILKFVSSQKMSDTNYNQILNFWKNRSVQNIYILLHIMLQIFWFINMYFLINMHTI